MTENQTTKKSPLPWIIGILCLIISFGLFNFSLNVEKRKFEAEQKSQCMLSLISLEDHLHEVSFAVDSLLSFYHASTYVDDKEFAIFCKGIKNNIKEFKALEWVPLVNKADLPKHEAYIQKAYPNYKVYEKFDGKKSIPVSDGPYFPVCYIYPMKGNEGAHGFNLASNPDRKAAIEKCIKEDSQIITKPITLVQNNKTAVLLLTPFKRNGKIEGVLLAVVETKFDKLPILVSKFEDKNISIDDVSEGSLTIREGTHQSNMIVEKEIMFGGRKWLTKVSSKTKEQVNPNSIYILVLSLGLSAFICLYLYKMTNYTQTMEKQVQERTEMYEKAKTEAQDSNKAKSEFIANMSHEIRTPMTAILGYTDLMESADASTEDKNEYLQIIRENGQHLLVIINDILDISKIEAGKMEVEKTILSP